MEKRRLFRLLGLRFSGMLMVLGAVGLTLSAQAMPVAHDKAQKCIPVREIKPHTIPRSSRLILRGKIEKAKKFGLPNLGEDPQTDSKFYAYSLRLSKPTNICVYGLTAQTYNELAKLGLWFWNMTPALVPLNKVVSVSGKIYQGGSGMNEVGLTPSKICLQRSGATLDNGKRCLLATKPSDKPPAPYPGEQPVNPGQVGSIESAKAHEPWWSVFVVDRNAKMQGSGLRRIELPHGGSCGRTSAMLASSGKSLYVTCESGGLRVLDIATGKIVHKVVTGNAQNMAIGPSGRRVYVANFGKWSVKKGSSVGGSVSVIDTDIWRVIKTIPEAGGPIGLSVGPKGKYLYVADMMNDTVSLISLKSLKIMKRYKVPDGPYSIAISPNGKTLYVSEAFGYDVAFINADSGKIIATVQTGQEPQALALSSNGKRLYVANHAVGSVSAINTATHRLIGTLRVTEDTYTPSWTQGPVRLMLGPHGKRLYATDCGADNKLVVVALAKR